MQHSPLPLQAWWYPETGWADIYLKGRLLSELCRQMGTSHFKMSNKNKFIAHTENSRERGIGQRTPMK